MSSRKLLGTVFQVAYVGSQGRHLRLIGDYNQGIGGRRPISQFTSLNASGQPVAAAGGAMTIQESVSNSNYNGMWLSAEKRLAKGLTFNASYTFSKSIDNNSVGSSNPQIQNFYNIAAERALSDFDARQRFVLSGIYLLPFKWDAQRLHPASVARLEHCSDRQSAVRQSVQPDQPDHQPEQPGDLRPSQRGSRPAADAAQSHRRRSG